MNPLIITSIALGCFFLGFFMAFYTVRAAYDHKLHAYITPRKSEKIQMAARVYDSSSVDLIDSSPEIVTIANLPEDTLNRYVESISKKNAALATERMRVRADEPTLKIAREKKEVLQAI